MCCDLLWLRTHSVNILFKSMLSQDTVRDMQISCTVHVEYQLDDQVYLDKQPSHAALT